jgi:ABC-type multidrug transport system fused ATPase/permease subunit
VEGWPTNGLVEFRNVSVRYRDTLPPALKNTSFVINPREKIGVVGRTGAGKSTITLAILRILETLDGGIYIDGLNIAEISL